MKKYKLGPQTIAPPPEIPALEEGFRRRLGKGGFDIAAAAEGCFRFDFGHGIPTHDGRANYLSRRWPGLDGYWVALRCVSRPDQRGEQEFQSLSIVVFFGELATGAKTPLFRVEWEKLRPEELTPTHAQPHWHVYTPALDPHSLRSLQGAGSLQQSTGEGLGDASDQQEEGYQGLSVPLSRFHFALAAQWHDTDGEGLHHHSPDADRLGTWSIRCLDYIREQLRYLDARAGT